MQYVYQSCVDLWTEETHASRTVWCFLYHYRLIICGVAVVVCKQTCNPQAKVIEQDVLVVWIVQSECVTFLWRSPGRLSQITSCHRCSVSLKVISRQKYNAPYYHRVSCSQTSAVHHIGLNITSHNVLLRHKLQVCNGT